jgi:hypothetical protein
LRFCSSTHSMTARFGGDIRARRCLAPCRRTTGRRTA